MSRLVVLGACAVAVHADATRLAKRWDGGRYLAIAQHGYPPTLHHVGERYSEWAFFPLFPILVRVTHETTSLSYPLSALLINGVLDVGLAAALFALAAAVTDPETATRSSLLFWLWPGSAALSLAYSEPLFLLLGCLCLRALLARRWVSAGLTAALAGATRPSGIALVAACAVAAAAAIRARRDWRALLAVALSPGGLVGFMIYGRYRTGDALIWQRAESLWNQRFDASSHLFHRLRVNLTHVTPLSAEYAVLAVSLVLLCCAMAVVLRDWRSVPSPLLAYLVVLLGLCFGYSNVGPRPRFVLAMVPVFVAVGSRLRGLALAVTAVVLAALLPTTAYLYTTAHVVP